LNILPDDPYKNPGVTKWFPLALRNQHTASLRTGSEWLDRIIIPAIPAGHWTFHAIPFTSEAFRSGSDPGVVLMRSASLARDGASSLPKEVAIPVQRRARAIYFLHTSGYAPSGKPFAEYRVVFRSGAKECIPLIRPEPVNFELPKPVDFSARASIGDWFPEYHPLTSKAVRPAGLLEVERRSGNVAYLYTLEWINPSPSKIIERIEVAADAGGPGMLVLFAITLAC
jgi:hypothetical protein